MISDEQGARLLELARESISSYFSGSIPDMAKTEGLHEKQGVFVTLHKQGQLRGCIGFPEPVIPLAQAIVDSARSAAFSDPRFPKLNQDELKEINIEISVLTIPKEIKAAMPDDYLNQIDIGRHGLIIKHPAGSGLILPQVAEEQHWNEEEFLRHLCIKAHLPPDTWMTKEAKIFSFEAQIFAEKK